MVFPWFSRDFPMVSPWFSYGFPMIFPWFSIEQARPQRGAVPGDTGPGGAAGASHGHGVWAPEELVGGLEDIHLYIYIYHLVI